MPSPGHSVQRALRSQPAHRQECCAQGGSRQRQGIPALICQVRRGLRDCARRELIDPVGWNLGRSGLNGLEVPKTLQQLGEGAGAMVAEAGLINKHKVVAHVGLEGVEIGNPLGQALHFVGHIHIH